MTKTTRLTVEAVNKKIRQVFAQGVQRAKEKTEDRTERLRERSQRIKYATGAAESPTPPPRTSAKRDQKILDVLGK